MTAPVLSLAEAITALHTGGVIAYPTEGVWGLGCDPRNEAAVLRLLAIKQRAPFSTCVDARKMHAWSFPASCRYC